MKAFPDTEHLKDPEIARVYLVMAEREQHIRIDPPNWEEVLEDESIVETAIEIYDFVTVQKLKSVGGLH